VKLYAACGVGWRVNVPRAVSGSCNFVTFKRDEEEATTTTPTYDY